MNYRLHQKQYWIPIQFWQDQFFSTLLVFLDIPQIIQHAVTVLEIFGPKIDENVWLNGKCYDVCDKYLCIQEMHICIYTFHILICSHSFKN